LRPNIVSGMNRVISQLAKKSSVTPAKAADQLDKFVHDLLQKLRRGEQAPVPGVGVISPGMEARLIKEPNGGKPARDRRRSR
jgi:nucleoid DNA-binding protein